MAQDDTFKCESCENEEKRKAPDYVTTSQSPCSRCGGVMKRK